MRAASCAAASPGPPAARAVAAAFATSVCALAICCRVSITARLRSAIACVCSERDCATNALPLLKNGIGIEMPTTAAVSLVADRDRQSVVLGKRVSVRVDLGGRRIHKKKHIHIILRQLQ